MWPFDDIGDALDSAIKNMISSAFDAAMKAIWDASLALLRGAFGLANQFSVFTVDTHTGPIAILWPMMLWISGVLALGLFFWQLTLTNLRGGHGFMRLISGPTQYGIALAVTVGLVAGFLAAVDGLTDGIWRSANIGPSASIREAQYWLHQWRPGFAERLARDWVHADCWDDVHHGAGALPREDRFTVAESHPATDNSQG